MYIRHKYWNKVNMLFVFKEGKREAQDLKNLSVCPELSQILKQIMEDGIIKHLEDRRNMWKTTCTRQVRILTSYLFSFLIINRTWENEKWNLTGFQEGFSCFLMWYAHLYANYIDWKRNISTIYCQSRELF